MGSTPLKTSSSCPNAASSMPCSGSPSSTPTLSRSTRSLHSSVLDCTELSHSSSHALSSSWMLSSLRLSAEAEPLSGSRRILLESGRGLLVSAGTPNSKQADPRDWQLALRGRLKRRLCARCPDLLRRLLAPLGRHSPHLSAASSDASLSAPFRGGLPSGHW